MPAIPSVMTVGLTLGMGLPSLCKICNFRGIEALRAALFADDTSIFDAHDPVGIAQRTGFLRDRWNAAMLLLGDARQQRHHRVSVLAIESGRRLVGQHDGRRRSNGACNGNALLLTTTEISRVALQAIGKADVAQHLFGAVGGGEALLSATVQRAAHVLK